MKTSATEMLPLIEEQIRQFEGRYLRWLRFTPTLERQYAADLAPGRGQYYIRICAISLVLYDLFLLADRMSFPAHFMTALLVRIGVVTPLYLVLLWLVQTRQSDALRELCMTAMTVLVCASTLYLGASTQDGLHLAAQPTVIPILILFNSILRIDLLYSVAGSLCCLALNTYAISLVYPGNTLQTAIASLPAIGIAVLTLFGNFTYSRSRRSYYLLRRRSELQNSLLQNAQIDLMRLASRDGLTNLSNRQTYENQLPALFAQAAHNRQPISAIMVDIDRFKTINDAHGHLYGDRVIQRVSLLLQQALRSEEDFAARYGGEEFVILLPDTPHDSALRVAERIRTLVEVAGSPALTREAAAWTPFFTTVSCGVATLEPQLKDDPLRLIEAADNALYQAKSEGRNRVCCATLYGVA